MEEQPMSGSYTLDKSYDEFVQAQVASGRYDSADAVLHEGLRLLQARDRQRAALAAAIEEGLEDERLGRLYDIEDVSQELDARYAAMIEQRGSR
tara:strand:+ start:168 stop:449 length:282 start_codon:yes stop_codon:yes gene_type:complete